jgi:hypothetical protein
MVSFMVLVNMTILFEKLDKETAAQAVAGERPGDLCRITLLARRCSLSVQALEFLGAIITP